MKDKKTPKRIWSPKLKAVAFADRRLKRKKTRQSQRKVWINEN